MKVVVPLPPNSSTEACKHLSCPQRFLFFLAHLAYFLVWPCEHLLCTLCDCAPLREGPAGACVLVWASLSHPGLGHSYVPWLLWDHTLRGTGCFSCPHRVSPMVLQDGEGRACWCLPHTLKASHPQKGGFHKGPQGLFFRPLWVIPEHGLGLPITISVLFCF